MARKLAISFLIMGLFVAAALVSLSDPPSSEKQIIEGALLVTCGVFICAFNRSLSDIQGYLAAKTFVPIFLAGIRPSIFSLMGVVFAVLGVLLLLNVIE